jgi:hypothetical protein
MGSEGLSLVGETPSAGERRDEANIRVALGRG